MALWEKRKKTKAKTQPTTEDGAKPTTEDGLLDEATLKEVCSTAIPACLMPNPSKPEPTTPAIPKKQKW